ncbi:MAG: YqgE/AlgH family protein [Bacteroidetes bacterium]|nr:YqgE/AlgH family protein [Bacteroidota bacterium]
MSTYRVKSGDFILAEPFLPDTNFYRSVVYLAEHGPNGSIGFVVNQPLGLSLKDVIHTEQTEELDFPLYAGGPVGSDTLYVLHQLGDHVRDSRFIARHTYWGGDFEQIKYLLINKNADHRDLKLFLGYSGWEAGQLDEEMAQGSWIVLRGMDELIFSPQEVSIWEEALRKKGGRYALLAKSPKKPDWN